jgi:hypothetical protein
MPGQTTCFQCGCVLCAESTTAPVRPPRMAAWKRPWRRLKRAAIRAARIIPHPKVSQRTAEWLDRVLNRALSGILLSIVPGVAHALQRRLRSVRLYLALWVLFLFGALFFYGGSLGMAFLGLAVTWHAWIALKAGMWQQVHELRYRLLAMGFVAAGLGFLYWGIGRLVLSDITGGYVTQAVEFHRVSAGDFVLARRSMADVEHLTRGSLVLAPMGTIQARRPRRGPYEVIAQIVALPGETLTVEKAATGETRFVISGQPLETDVYPVPRWLTRPDLSVKIPEGCCFLSTAYRTTGRYSTDTILALCVVPLEDIEAKVFMRWLPIGRRGFIREVE